MHLSESQEKFLVSKGLSIQDIEDQLSLFRQGTKYIDLVRPARLIDGIIKINNSEKKALEEAFEENILGKQITKFIPASGAATRMFKDLHEYLDNRIITDFVQYFIENIKQFAFYTDLKTVLEKNELNIDTLILKQDYKQIIEFLLFEKGLSYSHLPKGLLKFHIENNRTQTPIAEHIKEAKAYGGESPNIVFTISEEFEKKFTKEIESELKIQQVDDFSYNLTYQKSETDTVAVTSDLGLVELNESEFLIRPGGHGALIQNLNDVDADIIFIKNIDNVCSQKFLQETVTYKKALATLLLEIQEKIFAYSKKLENYDGTDLTFNFELKEFFEQELGIFSMALCRMNAKQKVDFFKEKLNRPIRVCGMVRNEGEPGGGPFWVKDKQGTIGLQIVESSQINHNNESQELIFSESSHFNPVDLVCAVKDPEGKKYNLIDFVDNEAYFIANKSFRGKDIMALEHPGLWNGGMGDWNTIFVEVSTETFNPVKTVNDLLRVSHQN